MGCEGRIISFKFLIALVPYCTCATLIKGCHLYYDVGSYELGTCYISYQWGLIRAKTRKGRIVG